MLESPKISKAVVDEIVAAIRSVKGYGSIEVYVQNNVITQVTVRNIKKTSVGIGYGDEPVKSKVLRTDR